MQTVFKLLERELKAQITILSAMCITLIMSLIITLVQSATDVTYNTRIKQACILSTESVFASYHNDCLKEYNIFLLEDSDRNASKLSKYLNDNLSDISSKVMLDGVTINSKQLATDNSGEGVYNQILGYMNYGVYADIIDSFKNSEDAVKLAETTKEISEDIADCEEELCELDAFALQLLSVVEGIKIEDEGIAISNGKPKSTGLAFAKQGIYGTVSMSGAGVNNEKVYNAVKSSSVTYIDLNEIIEDMYICLDGLEEIGDDASDANGTNSYANIFKRDYDKINDYITNAVSTTNKGIDIANEFTQKSSNGNESLKNLEQKIESKKEILGTDLYDSLSEDVSDMKTDSTSAKRSLCDIDKIKSGLIKNKTYLDNSKNTLSCIKETLTWDKVSDYRSYVDSLKSNLSLISNSDLTFDYSNIDFKSTKGGLSKVRKIYSMIQEGYLGLIISDTSTISDKKISYKDLSSNMDSDKMKSSISLKEVKDNLIYNEYLSMHFKSAKSFIDEDGKLQKGEDGSLDYMMEYILCGKEADKENLASTLFQMCTIREGMNLAYLLTDSQKRNEAKAMAVSLLGFTGNPAVIKGGELLILTAWAYGESIIDLRTLMKGGKVAMTKNHDTWQLDLESLWDMKFDNSKDNDRGFSYEDYLKMLLLKENINTKNMRTMGAIELKMIDIGHTDFRMKNYVVSLQGEARFKKTSKSDLYKQDISYSYAN